jgi:hypothetical protein
LHILSPSFLRPGLWSVQLLSIKHNFLSAYSNLIIICASVLLYPLTNFACSVSILRSCVMLTADSAVKIGIFCYCNSE